MNYMQSWDFQLWMGLIASCALICAATALYWLIRELKK